MAVTFTMLSLIILPSAYSQVGTTSSADVEAEVTTGTLTLTAINDFVGTVTMNSTTTPQDTVTVSYTSDATGINTMDVLEIADATDDPGYRLQAYSDALFLYDGAAGSTTEFAVEDDNFSICAHLNAGVPAAATKGTVTGRAQVTSTNTLNILASTSAASAQDTSKYTWDGSFTASDFCKVINNSPPKTLLTSTAVGINESVIQLRRWKLQVPGGQPGGTLSATIHFTAVDSDS